MQKSKEFFVIRFDSNDLPKGLITGPFATSEQAELAADACKPLYPSSDRLCVAGGDYLVNYR